MFFKYLYDEYEDSKRDSTLNSNSTRFGYMKQQKRKIDANLNSKLCCVQDSMLVDTIKCIEKLLKSLERKS